MLVISGGVCWSPGLSVNSIDILECIHSRPMRPTNHSTISQIEQKKNYKKRRRRTKKPKACSKNKQSWEEHYWSPVDADVEEAAAKSLTAIRYCARYAAAAHLG